LLKTFEKDAPFLPLGNAQSVDKDEQSHNTIACVVELLESVVWWNLNELFEAGVLLAGAQLNLHVLTPCEKILCIGEGPLCTHEASNSVQVSVSTWPRTWACDQHARVEFLKL
jgi:hypothetical protein